MDSLMGLMDSNGGSLLRRQRLWQHTLLASQLLIGCVNFPHRLPVGHVQQIEVSVRLGIAANPAETVIGFICRERHVDKRENEISCLILVFFDPRATLALNRQNKCIPR